MENWPNNSLIADSLIIIEEGAIKMHSSLAEISRKYKIVTSVEQLEQETIYMEKIIEGYKYLQLNSDKTESNMDLEFLFNAITNNQMKFETNDRIENEKIS